MKHQYWWVHKGRFTHGITNQQHQEQQLAQMGEAALKNSITSSQTCKDNHLNNLRQNQDKSDPSEDDELGELPPIQLQEHHFISPSVQHKVWLSTWLSKNQEDPTLKVRAYYLSDRQFWATSQTFLPQLKDHFPDLSSPTQRSLA